MHNSTFLESNTRKLNLFFILQFTSNPCLDILPAPQSGRITANTVAAFHNHIILFISYNSWPHVFPSYEKKKPGERSLSPLPQSEILRITINLHDFSFPSHLLSYRAQELLTSHRSYIPCTYLTKTQYLICRRYI